jgi:DNA processing protein
MNSIVSENTRAILLLTAPLIVRASGEDSAAVLTLSEYNRLASRLQEMSAEPADLIGLNQGEWLARMVPLFSPPRLESLLARGFQMSQAIDQWGLRGIWVKSRVDSNYPQRLWSRLEELAPAVIYGCGQEERLETRGLAIVGSRSADEEGLEFAESVGRLAAQSGVTVVSGGAKGVDRAAMKGALEAGGTVVGVLSDQLLRMAVAPDCREPIREGHLVLMSLADPCAGFNVGNAMQRNKIIYALADAALVVSADLGKGGTWSGAKEQLERFRSCALYVRVHPNAPEGNRELQKRGALPWPQPETGEELKQVLDGPPPAAKQSSRNLSLPLFPELEDAASASRKPQKTTVNPKRRS